MIAGGGLGPEEEGLGDEVHIGVILELVIEGDDVQHVEQLALVLVQALDLDIKDGIGVEHHAGLPGHPGGKAQLVFVLDVRQFFQHGLVGAVFLQTLESLRVKEVGIPAGAVPDEGVQPGVDLGQPAAVVDAVGHVGELLGPGQIGVVEDVLLQDLGVEGGDAVHRLAGADAQVGHAHLAAPDDGHVGDLAGVIAIAVLQLPLVAGGDLLEDDPDAGQQGLDEGLGPALQGLGQDGVVGVADGLGDDVPGVLPGVALHVQQDAHQLRDDQGGVGVVDLDDVLFMEVAQGAILGAVLTDDGLHRGGDEEVLLL